MLEIKARLTFSENTEVSEHIQGKINKIEKKYNKINQNRTPIFGIGSTNSVLKTNVAYRYNAQHLQSFSYSRFIVRVGYASPREPLQSPA